MLRRGSVGRIYGSVAKDLKFDWSMQVTWKRRVLVNLICMSIFPCIAARKLTIIPAVIFSYSCRSRWFIFTKQIVVLIWATNYSYLQRLFKTGVLKMLSTIQRKTTVSESLFNQPVACYFFNKRFRQRRVLVDTAKLSRIPFLQEHLETLDSVFMEHIWNYSNIKCNVN